MSGRSLVDLLGDATPAPMRGGVEHELQLWLGDCQLDFRTLLPVLDPQGVPDPGDPRARRLISGLALTADGWEAELATPPLPTECLNLIAPALAAEREALRRGMDTLRPGIRLTGFSTHVNVSVPDDQVVEVARQLTQRCSVALMLLLDGPDAPGLVVRPRRGRLEVCGDFVDGDDLAAAVTLVAACAAMLTPAGDHLLPPALDLRVEPARERFGFYVDRRACGQDLYGTGRATRVRVGGEERTAQDVLEQVWACARPFAHALGMDTRHVDERVLGRVPLPVERLSPADLATPAADVPHLAPVDTRARRVADSITVHPAWLTWEYAAWALQHDDGRSAYAVVPIAQEPAFLGLLDAGDLDSLLLRSLRPRLFAGRRGALVSHEQVRRPGVWRSIRPSALVPSERGPSGLPSGLGGGSGDPGHAKQRQHDRAPRKVPSRLLIAGAVAAVLLVIGGATAIATRGGGTTPAAAPGAAGTTTASRSPSPTPVAPTQVIFHHGAGVVTWKRTHLCAKCPPFSPGGSQRTSMLPNQVAALGNGTFLGQMTGGKDGIAQIELSGSPSSPAVKIDAFIDITDGSGHLGFGAAGSQCQLTMVSANAQGFTGSAVCPHVNAFPDDTGSDLLLYELTATFSWTP